MNRIYIFADNSLLLAMLNVLNINNLLLKTYSGCTLTILCWNRNLPFFNNLSPLFIFCFAFLVYNIIYKRLAFKLFTSNIICINCDIYFFNMKFFFSTLYCSLFFLLQVDLTKLDMYQKYEHKKPWFINVSFYFIFRNKSDLRVFIFFLEPRNRSNNSKN